MAQLPAPFTFLRVPEAEVPAETTPDAPAQGTATIPGLPATTMQAATDALLQPERLQRSLEADRAWFETHVPRRERGFVSETLAAGMRGAIPGTLESFGRALQATGLPGGEAFRGAATSVQEAYPGVFAPGQGASGLIPSAVESISRSIGVSVPALLGAGAVTATTGGSALIPLIGAYVLGGPAVLSLASGQQFYEAARNAGVDDITARKGAMLAGTAEFLPEVAGNALDTLLIGAGLTTRAARTMGRKIIGELGKDATLQAAVKPAIRDTLARLGATAAVEGGTELTTEALTAKIAEDTGLPYDPAYAHAASAGALAGLMFGMMGASVTKFARAADLRALSDPNTVPEKRLQVAQQIAAQMAKGGNDPELGAGFLEYARAAVEQTQPIPLDKRVKDMVAGLRPAPGPGPEADFATREQTAPAEGDFAATEQQAPAPVNVQTTAGPAPAPDVAEPVAPTPPVTEPRPVAPEPVGIPQPQQPSAARVQAMVETPAPGPEAAPPRDVTAPMVSGPETVGQLTRPEPSQPTVEPTPGPIQTEFPVADLRIDPERFQFKIAPGQAGTTGSLTGVQRFDPDLAGMILAWRDPADGQVYVVNGHNRVALAQRMDVQTLPIRLINAASPDEARATGALANIAEGRGTAFDAAKFFRDTGLTATDLQTMGIPLQEQKARQGLALSTLNPTLFGAALRGEVPFERAVLIGERVPDPDQQFTLLQLIDREARQGRRLTNDTVRELIDILASAPSRTVSEETLFGVDERQQSLALDKAELLAYLRQRLSREQRLFGLVAQSRTAAELGRAGNVIDIQRSQDISRAAAQLLDLFDRLKLLAGPVSEVVNAGVERLGAGEHKRAVQDDTYQRLLQALPTALTGGETPSTPGTPGGIPLEEPPPGSLLSTVHATTSVTITQAEVEAAFPGLTVTAQPNDVYRVDLPSGQAVDIGLVHDIPMGAAETTAFEVGYGGSPAPGQQILGVFRPQAGGTARIELVRDRADRVTLRHEVQHFLEHSGLLTPAEIQTLDRAMERASKGTRKGTEARAQWVAEQLNARGYRQDTAWGKVLDKVWDFFDRLLRLVGLQTTRGVLRQIETGEVLRRQADPASTSLAPQLAVTPPPRVTEPKAFLAYLGFQRMATPEVADLLTREPIEFTKHRVTMGELQDEAYERIAEWDENPALFRRVLDAKKFGLTGDDTTNMALRTMGTAWFAYLKQKRAEGKLTEAQHDALVRDSFAPLSVFTLATEQASMAGRTLRAQQEVPAITRFYQQVAKLEAHRTVPKEEWEHLSQEWMRVLRRQDPKAEQAFLHSLQDPTLWDYLQELRYGSMLYGPSTQIANAAGNIFWNLFNQAALRPIEGLLDAQLSKLQGRDRRIFLSETLPALLGFARGFRRERLRILPTYLTARTAREGREAVEQLPSVRDLGLPLLSKIEQDIGRSKEAWANARWGPLEFSLLRKVGIDPTPLQQLLARHGIKPGATIESPVFTKIIAPAVTLSMRAMSAVDLLVRFAAYDAELAGFAQRQAAIEAQEGGFGGQPIAQRRDWYLLNPTEEMRTQALDRAKVLTFMDEPSALARWVLQGRELPYAGKPIHLLIPFVSTVDRLIVRAVELTPLLGFIPQSNALSPSSPGFVPFVAKQLAGTVIALSFFELWRQGLLTGPAPDEEGEKQAFYRAGKQPYAMNLGGTWVSYRRFEPLNLTMSLGAILGEAMTRFADRKDDASRLAILGAAGMAAVHHLIDTSYFSGLQPLFNSTHGPADPTRALTRLADSFVPFQGLRATAERLADTLTTDHGTIIRNPQSWLEGFAGVSLLTDVRPRYNVWGHPMTIPGSPLSAFLPYRVSTATRDAAEQELARLKLYPGPPARTRPDGTRLSQDQYDALTIRQGRAAKAAVDRLVSSPTYATLSDASRRRALERALSQGRKAATPRAIPGVPTPS